jgi:hypothetical protein
MATATIESIGLPGHDVRYRLAVLSPTVSDVVRWAGGWLFDRSLAGCAVTAFVSDLDGDRALRILGVRAAKLSEALTPQLCDVGCDALVVSADLYRDDARVRDGMMATVEAGMTNVIMWASKWPCELEGLGTAVHHRLSIAARAFKAQALIAAGAPPTEVEIREVFRGLDHRVRGAACSHLVTAS